MQSRLPVPHAAVVRIVLPAEPFAASEEITLAFDEPDVARLVRHRAVSEMRASRGIVPDVMLAVVLAASAHYTIDDELILSFTEPELARVHRLGGNEAVVSPCQPVEEIVTESATTLEAPSLAARAMSAAATPAALSGQWREARRRQCVSVIDRLFTVERLGWYRHAFATRLLLAEDIEGEREAVEAFATPFFAFRDAALEALGGPLLEAYLPGFSVTSEWLERLEDPRCAALLGDLRTCSSASDVLSESGAASLGAESSIHAWIAALIATDASDDSLACALVAYRDAAIEAFSRVAGAPEAVRIGAMAQNNLLLDDRLWQLAGALHDSLASSAA